MNTPLRRRLHKTFRLRLCARSCPDCPWKVCIILRDHSHQAAEDSEICSHCGQPMPGTREPSYGERKTNRTGIAVTIVLHLLLVAAFLLQPDVEKKARPLILQPWPLLSLKN